MVRIIFLVLTAILLYLSLGLIILGLLRFLHPRWWRYKALRWAVLTLSALGIIGIVAWPIGSYHGMPRLGNVGAHIAPPILVLEAAVTLSLAISGLLCSIGRAWDRWGRRKSAAPEFSPSRRNFLQDAAAIFPAAAVTSTFAGVADSYSEITVPIRSVSIRNLPNSLQGFKIAHLSDLHLGHFVNLDDLEKAVEKIAAQAPDLALVTGDIADDLAFYPGAIEMINRLQPPYGIFASVGNHEYYRGIGEVLAIFANAPFPMIINEHRVIGIDGISLFLGGADDPRFLRRDHTLFLQHTIEQTMGPSSPEQFRLLMCHRPEGLNHSSEMGLDLVLSGHTHGGQIGLGGRSIFEPIFPEKYMWGFYRKGATTMYTSGGMGHWFPFRLGVPAEAPILILQKG